MRPLAWLCAILSAVACAAHAQDADQAIPAWRAAKRIALVPISGEIDSITTVSVMRRLDEAAAAGADLVVLELDTPGGDLKATLDLCALVRASPVRVMAWVHPQAYSAGAILALATEAIVVAPAGVFGDAAPIAALPGVGLTPLPDAERAKIEAPLLSEVVESARRAGRDERLVQRFVKLGEPLWLIERSDGSRTIADRQELATVGLREDDVGTGSLEGAVPAPWFQPYGQAPLRGSARARLTDADRGAWRVVARVAEPGTLLTVREREALALGLAEGSVADEKSLSAWTGGAMVSTHDESWSEGFVRWLTSWPVRLVLVAALLICFVGELLTPGVGAFGLGAAACLLALVGAPLVVGLADWWAGVAVIVGLGLVAVEILVVPGSTFVGIAGALCFGIGLIGVFVGSDATSDASRGAIPGAAGLVLGGLALGAVGVWAIRRTLASSALLGGAVLTAVADEAGATVDEEAPNGTAAAARPRVGTCGTAETPLRPAGQARFGRDLVDVVAIGRLIEPGERIHVTRVDGITTEVDAVEPGGTCA